MLRGGVELVEKTCGGKPCVGISVLVLKSAVITPLEPTEDGGGLHPSPTLACVGIET